ncbi:hypothetical protein V6N13_132979 [Hibiscus sabdariffa]
MNNRGQCSQLYFLEELCTGNDSKENETYNFYQCSSSCCVSAGNSRMLVFGEGYDPSLRFSSSADIDVLQIPYRKETRK